MGGGDAQFPPGFITEFLGNTTNRFSLLKNLSGNLQNRLACRGNMGQMLAAAGKDFDAEFILKHANLFADSRLGREKGRGSGRYIQIMAGHFPNVA